MFVHGVRSVQELFEKSMHEICECVIFNLCVNNNEKLHYWNLPKNLLVSNLTFAINPKKSSVEYFGGFDPEEIAHVQVTSSANISSNRFNKFTGFTSLQHYRCTCSTCQPVQPV